MYASENFLSNVITFSERSEPTVKSLVYYCQLAKIRRKYFFQIEQEFLSISQLFSLDFAKIGERDYQTILVFSGEAPLIYYQICTELVVGSTNLKDLDFLYQSVQRYPRTFDGNSLIAFLIRAIESPNFLEKK